MSTLMPMSRAASGSCAVARIALPSRLRLTKVVMSRTSGIVTPTARMSPRLTMTSPNSKTAFCESMRSSTLCGEPPSQSRPTFWRMKEKPTAVMRGASFGALRSGR